MTARGWRRALCLLVLLLLLMPAQALAENTAGSDDGTQGSPAPESTPGLAEETSAQPLLTAADVAFLLRRPDLVADVTGNGVVDAADMEALLLHAAGVIPDLTALPGILSDSLIGEKYLDRFSYTGVQRGDGYYRSETISCTISAVDGDDVNYYVAEILLRDLAHFRTAFGLDTYRRSEPVVDMAANNNAIVAINGDYYSWKNNKGLVIRNGILYRESIDKRQDLCVLYTDGTIETYAPDEADIEEILARGAYQSWSFGPSLLDEQGQAKTEKSQFRSSIQGPNPRSALGYVEPGHYLFVTVDGRGRGGSDGMTMKELSQLMYDLGCTIAYNLDGGGTAVMADASGAISRQSNLSRKCSDILYIVEDYTVYDDEAGEQEDA